MKKKGTGRGFAVFCFQNTNFAKSETNLCGEKVVQRIVQYSQVEFQLSPCFFSLCLYSHDKLK